ncbi:hypothetical protein E4U22_003710 [Claviceps purpurea]|nr:hypothetical protein E4U22_003710 [Claviceps purpurea]
MNELDSQDGAKQAEGMLDLTIWPDVNGREQLELLAGQHRIRALEEWVKLAKLGEEELWRPCKFYDEEYEASREQQRRREEKPEKHGRSEKETWEFFYPGKGSQKVDQSCRRRPELLIKLHRELYWQVYEHVVQRGQSSFNVHRILGLEEKGVAFRMEQVVTAPGYTMRIRAALRALVRGDGETI